jgi:hypothetical protein
MTRASSLPARPESTVYPIAVTAPLAIHLGGLRRSLVSLQRAGAGFGSPSFEVMGAAMNQSVQKSKPIVLVVRTKRSWV